MSYYAKVVKNTVVSVIRADASFFDDFIDDSPGKWIQTSYNTRGGVHYDPDTGLPSDDQTKALRYNYASIGYMYDTEYDAFYPPKIHDSWVLNTETFLWEAPIPEPDYNGSTHSAEWDEENTQWVITEH